MRICIFYVVLTKVTLIIWLLNVSFIFKIINLFRSNRLNICYSNLWISIWTMFRSQSSSWLRYWIGGKLVSETFPDNLIVQRWIRSSCVRSVMDLWYVYKFPIRIRNLTTNRSRSVKVWRWSLFIFIIKWTRNKRLGSWFKVVFLAMNWSRSSWTTETSSCCRLFSHMPLNFTIWEVSW